MLCAYALALGDASKCLPSLLHRLALALAEHVSLRRLYVFLLVVGVTTGATVPWVRISMHIDYTFVSVD